LTTHPASPHPNDGPGDIALPFAGLGLDLAEVRRKVSGLKLKAVFRRPAPLKQTWDSPTPPLYGYGLLLRLCRETLGS
jgi:hypothetical protein